MAFQDREETGSGETSTARRGLAHRLRRPADIKSVALTGLFVLAVFYTMYFMRAMLLPLVLALLLSYLLVPLVRVLAKIRIRPFLGAGIILLALIGAIGCGVSFLSEPAEAWIEKAPYSLHHRPFSLIAQPGHVGRDGGGLEFRAVPRGIDRNNLHDAGGGAQLRQPGVCVNFSRQLPAHRNPGREFHHSDGARSLTHAQPG